MSCKIAIPKFKEGLVRIYMQSKFTASLRRSGAKAVWIQTDDPEKAVAEACKCDGLLLPGGEDVDPAFYGQTVSEKCGKINRYRDETEMKILEAFLATGKPILGICRGVQLMNVYFGGTLHQDIGHIATCSHSDWYRKNWGNHTVTVISGSKLAAVMGKESFKANSLHHQAADTPAPCLTVSALSEDGIIEGLEHREHPFCIGVQWHPEHMGAFSKLQQGLFEKFIHECEK